MPRLLVLLAVLVLAGLAGPARSHAAPSRFDIGFHDPLEFPENDPAGAYRTAREEGARFIRLPATWALVAGARPPNASDPDDPHYDWSVIDGRIHSILSRGMQPTLMLYAPAPWARPSSGRETTNPADFGDFAKAAARR